MHPHQAEKPLSGLPSPGCALIGLTVARLLPCLVLGLPRAQISWLQGFFLRMNQTHWGCLPAFLQYRAALKEEAQAFELDAAKEEVWGWDIGKSGRIRSGMGEELIGH